MSIYRTLFMDEQDYWLSNYHELIETVIYSAVCFLVPFLLGHDQLTTGIIVNTALILAALNLRNERLLPVILLPSLGVLSRGIIFGPFTIFLVYMIPFIWIGNFLLIYLIKRIHLNSNRNRWLALGLASSIKTAFLFASAFILVSLAIIPKPFLISMGIIQLITAVAGGIIAFSLQKLKKNQFFITL